MTSRRAWLLLVLVGATACGPETSSNVRLQGQPVDVVFGAPKTPEPVVVPPPLVPGANANPLFPSIVQPELPRFNVPRTPGPIVTLPPTPTASPTPCPTTAGPGLKDGEAPPSILKKPAPASYVYTSKGSAQRTNPAGKPVSLDGLVARTYGVSTAATGPQYGPGAYTVPVTEVSGESTVVNTYLVNPTGGALPSGLYLSEISSSSPANGSNVFAPTTPLQIMPMPLEEQTTWRSAATDPRTQVTIQVDGLVRGKQRINFCGAAVEVWDLMMTGRIAGPGSVVNISNLVLQVGTQFGPVILHDELTQDGTDGEGQFMSTRSVSIVDKPHDGE